ncbi:MAG TPA: ATP-binding cassette domain-containing protein [Candidatus Dormibacteraeota bacterium]|nr:ATP-binding cassette domain-containing protein [Candidatus Dormibacteraeota bacterium]
MTWIAPSTIAVEGLTKAYSDTTGVFDVDFQVPSGSVMALLGPNGAGKTTIVRILSTLLRPDAGSVRIAGIDALARPRDVQALIGLANQSSAIDDKLTGNANLAMFGRLHRLPWSTVRERARELLQLLELTDAAPKAVRTYSGGMRRKLDLAVSLIGRPSILFLDEPTTGLDPASRQALWRVIRRLVADGTTVLLTTQNLDEADALANEIAFIDRGKVIARGTPAELKARIGGRQVELTLSSAQRAAELATALDPFHATAEGAELHVAIGDRPTELRALLEALERSGAEPVDYQVHAPNLDDVYFHLTEHARDAAREVAMEAEG